MTHMLDRLIVQQDASFVPANLVIVLDFWERHGAGPESTCQNCAARRRS